ncbi:OsmC family protein [Kitasatospora sp. NPDC093558]|uniref:OsmC family protein n=1 Tax=Kitasatospora sp. NPDC093558 TaxID=3155201 RepID=UPI0034407F2B
MADISVTLHPVGGSVVEGQARTHSVTVDRPVEKEGTDAGPMGGEYLLLALGGCYLSTFLAALKASDPDADPSGVQVRVDGALVPAPTRFSELTVTVSAPAALEGVLTKPLLKAERGCIVHNSIKGGLAVRFAHEWL